jgi:hypothetical protein
MKRVALPPISVSPPFPQNEASDVNTISRPSASGAGFLEDWSRTPPLVIQPLQTLAVGQWVIE